MSENKLYFCDELNNVLSCFHDRIMSCCSGQLGPIYYEGYRGQKIDWDAFRKVKTDAFELLTSENIKNSPCRGCFFLRERKESDVISPKFNMLNISHWTQCNCGCIYCARMSHSMGKITLNSGKSEYYDMLPLLKELYQQELLDREHLTTCIQGGDISVLDEFEDIVKESLKQGVDKFYILTNNIKYQPIIYDLLNMNKVAFTTSLDCADSKIYKKLKRVDKYNECVSNLRRYAKTKHPELITVKYIVIEHINDSIKEAKKFIDLMADMGIKTIEFMIDNKYILFTDLEKNPMPPHYKDLYLYFEKTCKENNISLILWDKTRFIVNKYLLNKV